MKEKELKLLKAINEIDGFLLEEASESLKKDRQGKVIRLLSFAACICLCVFASVNVMMRFDYFGFGCSAWPGETMNGKYYFTKQHKGIFSYDPETKTTDKVLSTFWYDDYILKDGGIYYTSRNKLTFLDLEVNEKENLYKAWGYGRITIKGIDENSIVVDCRNKLFDKIKRLRIDKITGDIIEIIHPDMSLDEHLDFDEDNIPIHVGERKLLLKEHTPSKLLGDFEIIENGVNILSDDTFAEGYSWDRQYSPSYEILFVQGKKYDEISPLGYYPVVIIITQDEVKIFAVPHDAAFSFTENFIFYLKDEKIYCLNIEDGSTRKLEKGGETNIEFYSFFADEEYIYVTVPWDNIHEVWKIEKDQNGIPCKMIFYDENCAD